MNMETIYLYRRNSDDQGIDGILSALGKSFFTLELPWRDNKPNKSCIPVGEYEVVIRKSPKFGTTYWVKDVPDRQFILIHSGNWAGDRSLGYKTHTYGCILLGSRKGTLERQKAILLSRPSVSDFMKTMNYQPFILKIEE